MKQLLICLSFFPLLSFGQIKIDDIGDGWKCKVEQVLDLINQYDQEKYNFLFQYCDHISFSLAPYSTNEEGHIILISQKEIINGNINNLAAIIIHESLHLYFSQNKEKFDLKDEEIMCYAYELDFLLKIPNIEPWLIEHANKQIEFYIKN
jgi:hypothetical protein